MGDIGGAFWEGQGGRHSCGAMLAAPSLPSYQDDVAEMAEAGTGQHHSPAKALALALEARVPWESGRVFTIRCLVLRASRAAGREHHVHLQGQPQAQHLAVGEGCLLSAHPQLNQYLLWGWRRCPGRAYHPPT